MFWELSCQLHIKNKYLRDLRYDPDSNLMSSYKLYLERMWPKGWKINSFPKSHRVLNSAQFLNCNGLFYIYFLARNVLKGFSTKDRKQNPKSSYSTPYIIASLRALQSKGLICWNLRYWFTFAVSRIGIGILCHQPCYCAISFALSLRQVSVSVSVVVSCLARPGQKGACNSRASL